MFEHMDANLDHIYFFIDDQPDASRNSSTSGPSNQCVSPRSEAASLGSNDTEATTVVSTSTSSSGSAASANLNPLAKSFTPTTSSPTSNATHLYELRNTDEKGYGLFATVNIPIGTRIICEAPLIRISENSVHLAWGPYCRLSNAQKAAFDKLHSYKSGTIDFKWVSRHQLIDLTDDSLDEDDVEEMVAERVRVLSTFAANNFVTGEGLSVFETAARLNHSCVPNVHHSFNPNLGKQTVHAARPIQAGEELLTNYLGSPATYYPQAQRVQMLQHSYGFTCLCPACSDSSGTSDGRRELMSNLAWGLQQYFEGKGYGQDFTPTSQLAALQQAEGLIHLLLQEGLFSRELMKAYRTASTLALDLKEYHKALDHALVEADVERNNLGKEIDDLKKIGAATYQWIDRIRAAAQQAGVTLKKNKKKTKRGGGKKEASTDQELQKKRRNAEKKKQKKKAKEAGRIAEREAEIAKREAERKKKVYEADFPGLGA